MVVDGASTRIALVSPHLVEKFIPRDHSSCILEEIGQGLELLACESDKLPTSMDFHGIKTYRHVPIPQHVCGTRISCRNNDYRVLLTNEARVQLLTCPGFAS